MAQVWKWRRFSLSVVSVRRAAGAALCMVLALPYAAAAFVASAHFDKVEAARATHRIAERPELRSYQPYSGLQFRFRPAPPVRRPPAGRPQIVAPTPVAPVIDGGSYASQFYGYCPKDRRHIEPQGEAYPGSSRGARLCR